MNRAFSIIVLSLFLCSNSFGAIYFNNTPAGTATQYVLGTANAGYDATNWTFSVWVYETNTSNATAPLSNYNTSSSANLIELQCISAGPALQFKVYANSGGFAHTTLTGGTPVSGVWFNVIGTYVNSTGLLTLYFNGSSVATATAGANYYQPANNPFVFGGEAIATATPGAAFQGYLDDFRFYNRVLSASEISTIALSRERYIITDGYIADWPLDDGIAGATVGSVRDISGNGLNMTNVLGSPTWIGGPLNYP